MPKAGVATKQLQEPVWEDESFGSIQCHQSFMQQTEEVYFIGEGDMKILYVLG